MDQCTCVAGILHAEVLEGLHAVRLNSDIRLLSERLNRLGEQLLVVRSYFRVEEARKPRASPASSVNVRSRSALRADRLQAWKIPQTDL